MLFRCSLISMASLIIWSMYLDLVDRVLVFWSWIQWLHKTTRWYIPEGCYLQNITCLLLNLHIMSVPEMEVIFLWSCEA
jgi:hypothetical protein